MGCGRVGLSVVECGGVWWSRVGVCWSVVELLVELREECGGVRWGVVELQM